MTGIERDGLLTAIDNLRGYQVGERQQRPYLAHVDQVYALAAGCAQVTRGAVEALRALHRTDPARTLSACDEADPSGALTDAVAPSAGGR